ncbi:hypothetical protein OS493_002310 [Desmophyllum pertusum]|uniref:Uncharacterized protein n=1 Tax=Desmophyllum pertusum TaxID=174260 RepID=A0A9W9YSU7_9CNID|nr:hypothetical protein OS493_002310 [Desmophyllum pertusum]
MIDISSEMLSSVVPFWEAGFISVLNEETALMSSPDLNYLSLLITVGQKYHFRSNFNERRRRRDIEVVEYHIADLGRDLCLSHGVKEEFVVVWGKALVDGPGVHILDALSGDTHHTLPNSKTWLTADLSVTRSVLSTTEGSMFFVCSTSSRAIC